MVVLKEKPWGRSSVRKAWELSRTTRSFGEWMSADEVDYDPPPETMGGPTISS